MTPTEQQLRAMVDTGLDAFVLLDRDARIVYRNPLAQEILGFSERERIGQLALDLVHPDEVSRAREVLQRQLVQPGSREIVEFRVRHRDGTWHLLEAAVVSRLEDPAVGAIIVSFRDSTVRRRTEEALRRLAYGTSATGPALFAAVVRHLVETLNAEYAFIGELLPQDGEARVVASFGTGPFEPGDLYRIAGTPCEEILRTGARLFSSGVSRQFPDDSMLSSSGIESYLGAPLYGRDSRLLGVIAAVSTSPMLQAADAGATIEVYAARAAAELERMQTEQVLRASEARYRVLLEEASDGIVVFDEEGNYGEANPTFCTMLGYSRAEVLAMHVWDTIAAEDLAREAIDWKMLRSGAVRRVERSFVRKDGTHVPAETRTKQLSDGRFLSIVRDITERRQAEDALEALRQREEQLRQAQKIEAIGRLAGGVAHDFNNVLTAIMGYADLLFDEFASDDPRRQDIVEIKKAAERAAGLTRQLLAFSRKQVLQTVEIDLNAIIGGVDKLLHRLMGEDVQVVIQPGADLPRVTADPGQLEQVLINLAVNARDAMPDGGRVTIATRIVEVGEGESRRLAPMPRGRYVALSVADTGHGIDPDVLPHIFEPFFTTKPQGKGTGLGLSTVYGIVKQSDSFIFVDSTPGQGATFTVYLPAGRPMQAAPTPQAVVNPASPIVLLVEDEASVRALASGVLRRQGYTVMEARDAMEAETISAREDRIDLLLTDIVMPGRNGHQLAELLRALRPNLRVIFMSGFSDERVRNAAAETDAPFLQKPFTPHALVNVVREALTTSA
jgi:PAS domain S-box-containing protein